MDAYASDGLAVESAEMGFVAAKDQLIDALRLAPDDAWSYVVLGNIFTREQDWDSAIRFFTKALDLKPCDPSLRAQRPWSCNGQEWRRGQRHAAFRGSD